MSLALVFNPGLRALCLSASNVRSDGAHLWLVSVPSGPIKSCYRIGETHIFAWLSSLILSALPIDLWILPIDFWTLSWTVVEKSWILNAQKTTKRRPVFDLRTWGPKVMGQRLNANFVFDLQSWGQQLKPSDVLIHIDQRHIVEFERGINLLTTNIRALRD